MLPSVTIVFWSRGQVQSPYDLIQKTEEILNNQDPYRNLTSIQSEALANTENC